MENVWQGRNLLLGLGWKKMSIRHVNKKEMSHTGKATGVVAPDLGLTSGGLSRQVSSILILKDLGLNASLFK